MNEFLQRGAYIPQITLSQPLAMEQLRMELGSPQLQNTSNGWSQEFMSSPSEYKAVSRSPTVSFTSNDFVSFQSQRNSPVSGMTSPLTPQMTMNGYRPTMNNIYRGGMNYGMGLQGAYSPVSSQIPLTKGKERVVELDPQEWEAQFAELEIAADKVEDQPVMETETDHFGDFESIWRGIQAEKGSEQNYPDFEIDSDMEQWSNFDGLNTHEHDIDPAIIGDYLFEEENIFQAIPNSYEQGLQIMKEGGSLSLAALAFEATVQSQPEHIDAWVALGQVQAQNEKEIPAIRAFERALKLSPNNLSALMSLAVSYTNEGYDSTAYRTLERWVTTKYPTLSQPSTSSQFEFPSLNNEDTILGFTDRRDLHTRVTNLFLSAAQLDPTGDSLDPDVQVGLGVLFYVAEEYQKAIDCFECALSSHSSTSSSSHHTSPSEIHLLWNRLGATKANSGRSEEAIEAYSRALELKPNFVRARYNLGVSCINIGCYKEAAGHLLKALDMHDVLRKEGIEKVKGILNGGQEDERKIELMLRQNQSTNLYDTLRRTFGIMGRRDLMDMVGPDMDLDQFRKEFEF